MKNKFLLLFSVITFILLLTACGGESESSNNENNNEEATDFPTETIEIIVPFAAGGGTDSVGRVLAENLKEVLDTDVIVVNREGGAGAIGMSEGLESDPDGHTITLASREIVSLPLLDLAPFDTFDFKYVSNVNTDPPLLVVNADSDYDNLQDLVDQLKDNPGELKYAGTTEPSLYGIQFGESADVEFNSVPYDGANPAIKDLLANEADFGLYSPGEAKSQIEGDGLKALAVMSEERIENFPDVPTMNEELGIDDGLSNTFRGIVVPEETPDDIVNILDEAIKEALENDDFIEFMEDSVLGINYMTSQDFTEFVENDYNSLEPLLENQ